MECKLLDKEDIELMGKFVDDENTDYEKENLMKFLNEKKFLWFLGIMKKQVVFIMQRMRLFMYMILGRRNNRFDFVEKGRKEIYIRMQVEEN